MNPSQLKTFHKNRNCLNIGDFLIISAQFACFILIGLSFVLPWTATDYRNPEMVRLLRPRDVMSSLKEWNKLVGTPGVGKRHKKRSIIEGSDQGKQEKLIQFATSLRLRMRTRYKKHAIAERNVQQTKEIIDEKKDNNHKKLMHYIQWKIDECGRTQCTKDLTTKQEATSTRGVFHICSTGYKCVRINDEKIINLMPQWVKRIDILMFVSLILSLSTMVISLILKCVIKRRKLAIVVQIGLMLAIVAMIYCCISSIVITFRIKDYIRGVYVHISVKLVGVTVFVELLIFVIVLIKWIFFGPVWSTISPVKKQNQICLKQEDCV